VAVASEALHVIVVLPGWGEEAPQRVDMEALKKDPAAPSLKSARSYQGPEFLIHYTPILAEAG
jgi:hypothetical protein